MTHIEAMKLALEHIEGNYTVSDEEAITALRQAIEQAQKQGCTRSHPHEEMNKECELRTEIARLTNCLSRANALAERFERESYLLGDELEKLQAQKQEPVAKPMTASRAVYFMERFKHEEKLLGPNEQAALDFVIAMLEQAQTKEPVARKKHEPTIDLDKYAGTYGGYTPPPQRQPEQAQKQEPVAWLHTKTQQVFVNEPPRILKVQCEPLYTSPPPRKPLTDDRCDDCGMKFCECGERT